MTAPRSSLNPSTPKPTPLPPPAPGSAGVYLLMLLGMCAVSVLGFVRPELMGQLALIPRYEAQWWGVLTSAFVHIDVAHLLANLVPLGCFLLMVYWRGGRFGLTSVLSAWFASGALLWLLGRDGAHIGASGWVLALFGLLLANAFFRRRTRDVLIAVGVFIPYSGLFFGVLPRDPQISWDGHLLGLLGGVLTSFGISRVTQLIDREQ